MRGALNDPKWGTVWGKLWLSLESRVWGWPDGKAF